MNTEQDPFKGESFLEKIKMAYTVADIRFRNAPPYFVLHSVTFPFMVLVGAILASVSDIRLAVVGIVIMDIFLSMILKSWTKKIIKFRKHYIEENRAVLLNLFYNYLVVLYLICVVIILLLFL